VSWAAVHKENLLSRESSRGGKRNLDEGERINKAPRRGVVGVSKVRQAGVCETQKGRMGWAGELRRYTYYSAYRKKNR